MGMLPVVQIFRPGQADAGDIGTKHQVLLDCCYHLEVDGLLVGQFYELTGGDIEIAVIEHDIVYESGDSTTLFIPGPTSFAPFTLKRGYTKTSGELYNWFAAASMGAITQARRNGSIYLKNKENGQYKTYVQWDFSDAWLAKLSGFSWNKYKSAAGAKLAVTIVAETIARVL